MFSGRTVRIYPSGGREVEAQTPFGVMYGEWVAPGMQSLMLVANWFAAMASEALAFSTDFVGYVVDKCVCSDGRFPVC